MTKKTQCKLDKGFFLGKKKCKKSSYFEEKKIALAIIHAQGDLPTFL
jgi:hypothetical protein